MILFDNGIEEEMELLKKGITILLINNIIPLNPIPKLAKYPNKFLKEKVNLVANAIMNNRIIIIKLIKIFAM